MDLFLFKIKDITDLLIRLLLTVVLRETDNVIIL